MRLLGPRNHGHPGSREHANGVCLHALGATQGARRIGNGETEKGGMVMHPLKYLAVTLIPAVLIAITHPEIDSMTLAAAVVPFGFVALIAHDWWSRR